MGSASTPLTSWIDIPPDSPFSLQNLPLGIISTPHNPAPRPAVAIGPYALDLSRFAASSGFSPNPTLSWQSTVFSQPTLNPLAALGRPFHRELRTYLQSIFSESTPHPHILKDNIHLRQFALIPLADLKSHLPLSIGDYTDFYCGLHHASFVGSLFRGGDKALQPNYLHLPVAYHGRASSVVVSTTPITRPHGQILPDPSSTSPIFSATKKLDLELELGVFLCKENQLGKPIKIEDAENHIFGYVLLNDWSARDIQAWEYVPLGPFGAKNFGTSISPWVVLADALEPFKKPGVERMVDVLDYLKEKEGTKLPDIQLKVEITPKNKSKPHLLTQTTALNLLYSFPQMLTHHSLTGCNMRVGDLLGSGTISGTERPQRGCLLEQTENGKSPLTIAGEERSWLADGDTVRISGVCGEKGAYVGFGECVGVVGEAVEY